MDINNKIIEVKESKIRIAQAKTYIDINELSLLCGYSVSTLRRSIYEGKLESTKRGKYCKVLFTHNQVNRFLNGSIVNEK